MQLYYCILELPKSRHGSSYTPLRQYKLCHDKSVDLSSIVLNLRGDHLIASSVSCHVHPHSTVSCPRGTYQTVRSGERVFNGEGIKESYPVCRVCPVSSYQDQVASTDCKICPEYYQTRGPGSTSREDCYGNVATIILHTLATSPIIINVANVVCNTFSAYHISIIAYSPHQSTPV